MKKHTYVDLMQLARDAYAAVDHDNTLTLQERVNVAWDSIKTEHECVTCDMVECIALKQRHAELDALLFSGVQEYTDQYERPEYKEYCAVTQRYAQLLLHFMTHTY